MRDLLILLLLPASPGAVAWDVAQPRGETREIDFHTSEGTALPVDLSPDGQWVVFDLLAHIYRVSVRGGEAECLTQNSGIALNYHPRFSPDGKRIAFVSDRLGQDNLWVMDADGGNPSAVVNDLGVRNSESTWMPDGRSIVALRFDIRGAPDYRQRYPVSIWMYNLAGGQGMQLVAPQLRPGHPSVSPDGKFLYYHVFAGSVYSTKNLDFLQGDYQVRRLTIATSEIRDETDAQAAETERTSNGGALAPRISPDSRWLAFARRIPLGTFSYKGHKHGPRTALWLRDLETGAERVLIDPIKFDSSEGFYALRLLPGYGWASDSNSIVVAEGGKIRHVWLSDGHVDTVSFTARVHRSISEMAHASFRISDEPAEIKLTRWPSQSPKGKVLAFVGAGKIYLSYLPGGVPRRLTPSSFRPLEYSPEWSPDGKWIAFVTRDECDRGALWKISAQGTALMKLTPLPGDYINPSWVNPQARRSDDHWDRKK